MTTGLYFTSIDITYTQKNELHSYSNLGCKKFKTVLISCSCVLRTSQADVSNSARLCKSYFRFPRNFSRWYWDNKEPNWCTCIPWSKQTRILRRQYWYDVADRNARTKDYSIWDRVSGARRLVWLPQRCPTGKTFFYFTAASLYLHVTQKGHV